MSNSTLDYVYYSDFTLAHRSNDSRMIEGCKTVDRNNRRKRNALDTVLFR